MANNDNVRVLYKDGLILGADELSDDQSYFRAALERRSLAGTPQGIAYGLALTQQTDGPVILAPGVAWDGNGKAVVVRQQVDLSGLLSGEQNGRYAVFLVFVEKNAVGKAGHVFCGAPMDPRIEEVYRIEVTSDVPLDPGPGYRGPSRRAPQSSLPAPSDRDAGRILLGIVKVESPANGGKTLELSLGKSRIPGVDLHFPPIAERAEYAGTATAALIHPRHWTESGQAGATRAGVALELDPDRGVHVHQPAIHHAEVHFIGSDASFNLSVDKTALTLAHSDPFVELLKASKDRIEILSDLKLMKAVEVTGPATFQGSVEVKGSLEISGTTKFGAVTAGDATVNGKLSVKGAAIFDDTLSVAGEVKLTGASKQLSVEGPAVFKNTVNFAGGTTGANFGALSCTSLIVTGIADFNTEIMSKKLTVATISETSTLKVTNEATITKLTVAGKTTLSDVLASGPIVARGGIAIPVSGSGLTTGMVVAPDPNNVPVGNAVVAVIAAGDSKTAIGIYMNTAAGNVAVGSGYAEAQIDGALPQIGSWLKVKIGGKLELDNAVPPQAGTRVAKLLSTTQTNGLYPVLVCFG